MIPILVHIALQAACVFVDARQITAGDLAKVDPAFASLAPSLVYSYAPKPGTRRTIHSADLGQWAQSEQVVYAGNSDLCFERKGAALSNEQIATSIQTLFSRRIRPVQVEVLEHSSEILPPGVLDFAIRDASLPPISKPETPVLWRGKLVVAENESYPIWTKVRLTSRVRAVRALQPLHASSIIRPEQIESAEVTQSPLRIQEDQDVSSYAGKVAVRGFEKGSILELGAVAAPFDVDKGDEVTVEVLSGSARLSFSARAITAGHVGETILLANPSGARQFRGTVAGKGEIQIVIPSQRHESQQFSERKGVDNATTVRSSR